MKGSIKFEEIWSSGLSALGALLAVPATFFLLVPSLQAGKAWHVAGFMIYGIGLFVMFTASTLYHGYEGSEAVKRFLHRLDYCAVATAISSGFTPFCLILERTYYGYMVLTLIWFSALSAVYVKLTRPRAPKWVFVLFYLGMGWAGLFLVPSLIRLGWGPVLLMSGGGLSYSIGAVFFNWGSHPTRRFRFGKHEIWHLFILAGATAHFLAIFLYLLPY
ncbi:MAG: hemolysin III family protein [Elusimicrobiota bacterium]